MTFPPAAMLLQRGTFIIINAVKNPPSKDDHGSIISDLRKIEGQIIFGIVVITSDPPDDYWIRALFTIANGNNEIKIKGQLLISWQRIIFDGNADYGFPLRIQYGNISPSAIYPPRPWRCLGK